MMSVADYIKNFKLGQISYSKVCVVLIFIWVFFLMSARINIVISYIHWYLTILVLPFLIAGYFYNGKIKIDLFFLSAMIFLLSLCPIIPLSLHPIYTLGTCVKLFLIFFSYLLLSSNFTYLRAAFSAFICAVILNGILLFLGLFFHISYLARIAMGGNRWMTILSAPGFLGKVGVSVFVYSLYYFIVSKKFSLKLFVLFLCSISLVIFDGSRTDFIAVLLGLFYCGFLIVGDRGVRMVAIKRTILRVVLIVVGYGCISFFGLSLGANNDASFRYGQAIDFVKEVSSGSLVGLERSDRARYSMLKVAFKEISEHPLIGKGMYSTGVEPKIKGGHGDHPSSDIMDIHMTYLGVWANFGFLSFLAFIFLVFSWLLPIKSVFYKLRNSKDIGLKALGYNAAFLLFFFAFGSLFHPLSNEWPIWILVLVPAGIYWQFANSRIKV